VDRRLARGLIAASVLIDLDHIPQYRGAGWLTAGTDRPYPHSLLSLLGSSAAFLALRRTAPQGGASSAALGILIGLGAHFFRDLAVPSCGVPLLWPIQRRAFSIPRGVYLASLATGLARNLARRHAKRCRFA
jgi:inner membrane protein